jgi:hypothetical protein
MVNINALTVSVAEYILHKMSKYVDMDEEFKKKLTGKAIARARRLENICKGYTAAGTPCSRNAKRFSDYCWQHQGTRMATDHHRHRSLEEKNDVFGEVEEQEYVPEVEEQEYAPEVEEQEEYVPEKKKKSRKHKKSKSKKAQHSEAPEDPTKEFLQCLPISRDRRIYVTLDIASKNLQEEMRSSPDAAEELGALSEKIDRKLTKVSSTQTVGKGCEKLLKHLEDYFEDKRYIVDIPLCKQMAKIYVQHLRL